VAVGAFVEGDLPEEDLVAAAVELHRAIAERFTAPADAGRPLGDFELPEHELAHGVLRNLEIDLVVEAMDGEDAGQGLGVLGDDVVVLLEFARFLSSRLLLERLHVELLAASALLGAKRQQETRDGKDDENQDAHDSTCCDKDVWPGTGARVSIVVAERGRGCQEFCRRYRFLPWFFPTVTSSSRPGPGA